MARFRFRVVRALPLGVALLCLLAPASASAGAAITPVPTFPFPNVMLGQTFNASITMFNNSTGQESQAGVTITGSNLELFPSCPDSAITANDCPNSEAGVFTLSASGTSGAGNCPPGSWAITELVAGRWSFAPPGTIQLQPSQTCTVDFTAVAVKLPQFDSSLSVPGVQTNQIAAVDAFSPVTGLTVRNSGSSTTGVLSPPPPSTEAGATAAQGARLKVSEGCPRVVKATVSGNDIQSVTFFVDGKRQKTVNSPPFTTRVKAAGLSPGRHKLRADVTFTAASGQLATGITGGFLRCKPRAAPRFTG